MQNDTPSARYTEAEMKNMIAKGEDQTDWAKVDAMTDTQLETLIAKDPDEDAEEWDWEHAALVMPAPKQRISLRVDTDVLQFFKADGKGYQTRMNAVLRSYMKAHTPPSPPSA